MHHAGATQLDPAGVFANSAPAALALKATEIKLSTRLCKRKVRWAKPCYLLRPEHPAKKLSYCSLQMRHGNAAIDAQTFNLKKHRIVRRIGSISSENTTRRNHSHRHTTTLHCVDLYS